MNNHSLVGASYSGPGHGDASGIQTESALRERLEKAWGTLGEALCNVHSINGKLFMSVQSVPCDPSNVKIEGVDTSNIENLICLIESLSAKLEIESREISNRV